jgi:hypothetical protein
MKHTPLGDLRNAQSSTPIHVAGRKFTKQPSRDTMQPGAQHGAPGLRVGSASSADRDRMR